MYEGSMYGAGVAVFAVWGYVISHVRKGQVELNPKKLADTLGGTVEEIRLAIDHLTRPDPESRHKEHDGRRLIRNGEFQYEVPSWQAYQAVRNEDDRREYNRMKQREYRARKKGIPLKGETSYVELEKSGASEAELDRKVAEGLPVVPRSLEVDQVRDEMLARAKASGDLATVQRLEMAQPKSGS